MKSLITLALVAAPCLSGCSSPTAEAPPEPAPQAQTSSAEQSLNAYAKAVVEATKGNVSNPTPAEKTLDAPLSYVIKFHTSDPALMAKDKSRLSRAFNAALQEGWNKRFCTSQLKSLMATNGIFLVSGHLLDTAGKLQVFTSCMR